MKILLVAINAKYIHSNLAVYCLKAYAEKNMPQDVNVQIELAEYTINQNRDEILKDIYRRQAEIICFSCYIWNLDYVESMIRDVKKVMKDVIIWAGGLLQSALPHRLLDVPVDGLAGDAPHGQKAREPVLYHNIA